MKKLIDIDKLFMGIFRKKRADGILSILDVRKVFEIYQSASIIADDLSISFDDAYKKAEEIRDWRDKMLSQHFETEKRRLENEG